MSSDKEAVNHPDHYGQVPGIECIEVVKHFDFCRGNAIKYLWRAGAKGDVVQDLRKAIWYIEQEISDIEERQAGEAIETWLQDNPVPPVEFDSEARSEGYRRFYEDSGATPATGHDEAHSAAVAPDFETPEVTSWVYLNSSVRMAKPDEEDGLVLVGSSKERQERGLPGHCDECTEHGHVKAHPDLGCADVGCDYHHNSPART